MKLNTVAMVTKAHRIKKLGYHWSTLIVWRKDRVISVNTQKNDVTMVAVKVED
jgi:hypothetical protein